MSNPVDAAEFKRRLEAMPPDQQNQMQRLLQIIAAPPETLLSLFDRLGIRWKREYVGAEGEYPHGALIIDWRDFMAAEKENQEQGPVLKRLIAQDGSEIGATKEQSTQAFEAVVPQQHPIAPPELYIEPEHYAKPVVLDDDDDYLKGVQG